MPEVRQFKQIKGVDYTGAQQGLVAAGKTFDKAFGTVGGVLKDFRESADLAIDKETTANTEAFQSRMEGISSLGSLNEQEASGAFGIDARRSQFGTRIGDDAAEKSIEQARSRLRNSAVSAASGIARSTAQDAEDMQAGSSAMYQELIDSGAHPDYAQQQANSWLENAKSLKNEINKTIEDRTIELIENAGPMDNNAEIEAALSAAGNIDTDFARQRLQRIMRGTKEDKAAARIEKTRAITDNVTKNIVAYSKGGDVEALAANMTDEGALEFRRQAKAWNNTMSQLDATQSATVKNENARLVDTGNMLASGAQAKIASLRAELDSIPEDDASKTAEAFGVDGMNDMRSVITAIGDEQNWTVDEQPDALYDLQTRLQTKYGRNDTVALIAQAWTDTRAKSSSWHGASIDVEMMEIYIGAMLANRTKRKEKQAQIDAAINTENIRALTYSSMLRNTIANLTGTMMARNTGRNDFDSSVVPKSTDTGTGGKTVPDYLLDNPAIAAALGQEAAAAKATEELEVSREYIKEQATKESKAKATNKFVGGSRARKVQPFNRLRVGSSIPMGKQSPFVETTLDNFFNPKPPKRKLTSEQRAAAIARVRLSESLKK